MSKPGKQAKAQVQRSKRIAMNKSAARMLRGRLSGSLSEAARIAGATAGTVTLASALGATPAHALPQNGTVVGGTASIAQTAGTMNINQSTNSAIINWQGYNIGVGESVHYLQPGSNSIILNRVTGVDPSAIYGSLSANGQVWVINPNGLVVGAGARVETASFLGSTLGISNEDFSAGNYRLTGASSSLASIVNHGNIQAADGGYVVLAAPSVTNSGVISANLGKVMLASGDQLTLGFHGNDLIDLVISEEAASGALGVKNTGAITADGGTVVMSAKVAADLLQNVVNNEGVIRATSIVERDGAIILDGGEHGAVTNSGTLDASGRDAGERGGAVKVLGDQVQISSGAVLDASGDAGGGTLLVGGNFHGEGAERNSSATTIAQGVELNADAVTDGDGGSVAVWSDGTTRFYGNISARGGATGGSGGHAEVSGKTHLSLTGFADLRAPHGEAGLLEIDPGSVSIIDGGDAPNAEFDTFTDGWINTQLGSASLEILTKDSANNLTQQITLAPNVDINWISGNTLTLTAGNDITLGGSITAAIGGLTLNFDQSGTGATLALGSANVNVGTVSIAGSGGTSTIVGPATASTFKVSGADAGIINDKWTFNGVGNLTGGAGDDTFTIGNTGTLSGSVIGGSGYYNRLDLSAKDVVTVNKASQSCKGTATGIASFSDIQVVVGNGANSTFIAHNGGMGFGVWGLDSGTASDKYTSGQMEFRGFGNLIGGSSGDSFVINSGGLSGNIDGGLGRDELVMNASSKVATFDLGNRTATGIAGTFTGVEQVVGNGINTTLVGRDTGEYFAVTGVDSGVAGEMAFIGVVNLTGGSGADSFVLQNGGSLSGNVVGGGLAGDGVKDSLDLSAMSSVTLDQEARKATGIGGTFDGIERALGNGANSTLVGHNSGETFTLTGVDSGTADSGAAGALEFSAFANLTGGSGADSFILQDGGSLTGNLVGGGFAGDGVTDSLDLSAKSSAVTFDQRTNTATGIDRTFDGIEAFAGNGATSTIIGLESGQSYKVTGSDSGTAGAWKFSGVGNLTGGSGADTFVVASLGTLSGNLDGGGTAGDGVTDTLDLSAKGSVTVDLEASEATGINGSFSGIERALGNGANSTLIGHDSGETFTLTGVDSGTADSGAPAALEFSAFANLTGGSGADSFILQDGGSLTGNLEGGGFASDGVTDSLDLSARSSTVTFDQRTNKATGIGGNLSGIEAVVGNGANSTIIGTDLDQAFVVNGGDTGMAGELKFSGVGNLTGGSGSDSFTFQDAGTLSGNVVGGGFTGDGVRDSLDLSAKGSVTFDRETGKASGISGTVSGIERAVGNGTGTLVGRNGGEIFTVTGVDSGTADSGSAGVLEFSGFANLTGGSGADSFILKSGGILTGSVAGGGSAGDGVIDSLDLSAKSSAVTFDQRSSKATGIDGTFSGIEAVVGNGINSTIIGDDLGEGFEVSGRDTGMAGELNFSGVGNLAGGSGYDSFTFRDAGTLSGNVVGGGFAGDGVKDTLDLRQKSSTITFDQKGKKATGIDGTFDGIESVVGNGAQSRIIGADLGQTFRVTGADTGMAGGLKFYGVGNVTGGSGADTFVLETSGSLSGSVAGGGFAGDGVRDSLDLSAKGSVTFNQGTGKATGITGTVSGIERAVGNGTGTLVGHNGGEIFTVTGVDSGTADSGAAGILEFSGFANLTGGSGADSFILKSGGTLTGSLAGGGSAGDGVTDALDLSAKSSAITFDQRSSKATGINGTFSGIEAVVGNGINSTIIAADVGQRFEVSGGDTGRAGSLKFSGVGNLTGGSGDDTFALLAPGVLSGNLAGGGGKDTLDLSGKAQVTVNQQQHTASGIAGTYSGIERAVGNGANSTIIGHDHGEIFIVTGRDSGTADANVPDSEGLDSGTPQPDRLEFAGFGNLTGGSLDDYFYIKANGSLSGNIDGGADVDHLYMSQKPNLTLNLQTRKVTDVGGTFANFESVSGAGLTSTIVGHNLGNTFRITGADSGTVKSETSGNIDFQGFGNLVGGTGNDSFFGLAGSSLSGIIADTGGLTTLAGTLNTGSVQSYAGTATLASGTTLRGDRVTLNVLNGAGFDLTIDGAAVFNGADVTGVKDLQITGATEVNVAKVSGSGSQRYDGLVTLGADTALSGSAVTVNAVAGGSHDLTVISSGTGGIAINGAVGTTGGVELIALQGAITETSAGAISAASLATASAGGQMLEGANSVSAFDATNSGTAPINFKNSSGTLAVTGISNPDGSVNIVNNGNISLTGVVDTAHNVVLTSVGGTIAESGAGSIVNAALLTTTSAGGQNLNGDNRVQSFNATTSGGGALILNNATPTLTIVSINQLNGGAIRVTNIGNISIPGSVRSTDDITLTSKHGTGTSSRIDLTGKIESGKTVELAAEGVINEGAESSLSAATLSTSSRGGENLLGKNSVTGFGATNDGGGAIAFTNEGVAGSPLSLGKITQVDGGDISITNAGDVKITGATSTAGADTVAITSTSGSIKADGGSLTAGNLEFSGAVIGADHDASISIEASSVTTNTTQEIDGLSAAFVGTADQFTIIDEAPSVVTLNGVVVGGKMAVKFDGATQFGNMNAAMGVTAQEMQEMLMLANFQEFFAHAPDAHFIDADDPAFTPVQEIIPGFLSDGRPCQLIDEKIKQP